MSIPIPVGMDYTSTTEGSALKHVTCEQCHLNYVYYVTRRATGRGSSPLFLDNNGAQSRALERAERALKKLLDEAVDPVPCMGCGYMQQDMVREARKRFHRWAFLLGLVVAFTCALTLPVCYVSGLTHTPLFTYALIGVAAGLLIMGLRAIALAGYNPSSPREIEKWTTRSADTAMTLADHQALQARRQAAPLVWGNSPNPRANRM